MYLNPSEVFRIILAMGTSSPCSKSISDRVNTARTAL